MSGLLKNPPIREDGLVDRRPSSGPRAGRNPAPAALPGRQIGPRNRAKCAESSQAVLPCPLVRLPLARCRVSARQKYAILPGYGGQLRPKRPGDPGHGGTGPLEARGKSGDKIQKLLKTQQYQ